jgi:hypothetical protein
MHYVHYVAGTELGKEDSLKTSKDTKEMLLGLRKLAVSNITNYYGNNCQLRG